MLKLFFRLVFKDLKKNKVFSFLFLLSLSFGMIGYVFIQFFKTSIQRQLNSKSREMMSSDLSISSRRKITNSELSFLLKNLQGFSRDNYEILEMFSMIYVKDRSKLIEVKTIPSNFPFYGKLKLQDRNYSFDHDLKLDSILIDKNLSLLMDLKIGDLVKLGESELKVSGIISEDSTQAVVGFSLGPRVYISPEALKNSQLVKPGSTIRYSHHFFIPHFDNNKLEKIKESTQNQFADPGVRVRTHHEASEELARTTTRFNDFLALVAIVSLFLAGIGSQFLFRQFLLRHLSVTALLNSLGWTKKTIIWFYLFELFFLSLFSFILSNFILFLFLPSLLFWINQEFQLEIVFDYVSILKMISKTFWLAPTLSFTLSLPLIANLYHLKVAQLFQGRLVLNKSFSWHSYFWYLPALFLFYFLSVIESGSFSIGSLFFLLLFLSVLMIGLILLFLLKIGEKWTHKSPLVFKLPFLYLKRNRVSTISYFLALALGTLLMTLVPSLELTIRDEIQNPGSTVVPNLFLFDIQPEQVEALELLLKNQGHELSFKSPLIRGRLLKINGKDYQYKKQKKWFQTREADSKERLTNRVLNFSYRQNFSDAETITSGRSFSVYNPSSTSLPEVSLEKRFAENFDIKLGDQLTFDIQDVPVVAQVVSLRSVKWLSFQPNFFIQFQPGILDDAPKTFLAGIKSLTPAQTVYWQQVIGKKFSNISFVDVKDSLSKITQLMEKMAVALKLMAILCIAVGFFVIFCLSQTSVFERLTSFNILKVLGMNERQVLKMVLWEYGIVTLTSQILGLILSVLVSFVVSHLLFERFPLFPWTIVLSTILSITFFALVICFLSIFRLVKGKPSYLLRELPSQS
jgi:putative ABC transport system permease protein